ncbi:TolC family protein [Marinitoga arctica]
MKKGIFLVILSLFSLSVFSFTTADILDSVVKKNTDYLLNDLNYENDMIDYENSKITANSTTAKLNVQNMYFSIMRNYENTKINISKSLVNYLFNLKNAQINVQIKQLSFENAKKNYEDSLNLYKKNLISHSSLLNSEYGFKNAKYNFENAKVSLIKTFEDFSLFTKSDEATINYEIKTNFPDIPKLMDDEILELINKDYDYLMQQISYQISLNEYNATKDFLTGSELKKKEIDLRKKQLSLEELKISKIRAIKQLINDINLSKLDLASSEINLKYLEEILNDSEKRYNNGIIEKSQYNQSKISYLSAISQINNKRMGLVLKYIDLYNYFKEDINKKLIELIEIK